ALPAPARKLQAPQADRLSRRAAEEPERQDTQARVADARGRAVNDETTVAEASLALDVRDRAAVARALTLIERGGEAAQSLLMQLRARDPAIRIGITGAPGAGKSTLTMQLVRALRRAG